MRRFPIPFGVKVFAFIWLVVLCVPQLRESFKGQAIMSGDGPNLWTYIDGMNERFPQDPRVLELHIWGKKARRLAESTDTEAAAPQYNSLLEEQINYLDSLIRRFPKENWLRADRLALTLNYVGRIDPQATPANPRKGKAQLKMLQGALLCVREAQKREPDNGYFPWIETILRFSLGQQDAGFKALEKVSHTPRFNNYYLDGRRRTLATYSMDHPLLFEDKCEILIGHGIFGTPTASLNQGFKTAIQLGLKAQQAGDDKRALQIYHAVLGSISVITKSPDDSLTSLIGKSMGLETFTKSNEARGIAVRNIRDMPYEERTSYTQTMAREFGSYARRFGREDVAQQAWDISQMEPAPFPGQYLEFWNTFGLEEPWSRVALQGNWFAIQMALWSFGFGFIWLLSKAIHGIRSRRGAVNKDQEMPSRGQVTLSTNFCLWATVGYAAVAAYFGVGFILGQVGWVQSLDMGTNEIINETLTKMPLYVAIATWLLPAAVLLIARDWKWIPPALTRNSTARPFSRRENGLRLFLWSVALFTDALAYTNGRGLWDGTIFQWFVSPILAAIITLAALGYETYRLTRLKKLELGHINREPLPHRWIFAGRLLGSCAGALAVIWSVFFLLGVTTLWPLRATMNRAIETRIGIGEVKWMEELDKQDKRAQTP